MHAHIIYALKVAPQLENKDTLSRHRERSEAIQKALSPALFAKKQKTRYTKLVRLV